MSKRCEFHRIESKTLPWRDIGQSTDIQHAAQQYCTHREHAPVTKRMLIRGVKGEPLNCGGSLDACPIKDKL